MTEKQDRFPKLRVEEGERARLIDPVPFREAIAEFWAHMTRQDPERLAADRAEAWRREDWGTLTNYDTGEPIRPATREEWERTAERVREVERGGMGSYSGEWSYWDDGREQAVYVDGGPEITS